MKDIKLAYMNPEQVANEIGNFIVDTVRKTNSTGGVIGLSGGVDSTTTAALAKRAFDRVVGLELIGYILPSATNAPEDEQDGVKVAKRLGIRYQVIDIEPVVRAYTITNPEVLTRKFDKGNMMSRIRANVLSTKAATEKKLVLGTGNKDEDFGIGYYTLFGDGAVHLSPIAGLPKRLVRQMATYLGFPDLANRVPTAGLEPGQTDAGDLGYNYDAAEVVLEGDLQGFSIDQIIASPKARGIILPQLPTKFTTVDEVVNDVLRRHYTVALPKMEIMHPPAAQVTLEYRE